MRVTRLVTFGAALVGAVFMSLIPTLPAGAHPIHDADSPIADAASWKSSTPPTTAAQFVVPAGASLSSLAPGVGRTWQQLARWNHLADPNLILAGQVLQIPPAGYQPPRDIPPKVFSPNVTPARESNIGGRDFTPNVAPVSPAGVWGCIAAHESGGNPAENTGNGYYGAFQFAPATWDTMMSQLGIAGYSGYPYAAAAPYGVQLEAAEHLQAEAGWGQWPVTSRACGA